MSNDERKKQLINPPIENNVEEKSQGTPSDSSGKIGHFIRRFSPVLVPLPFAILIFLFTLPFALRGLAFLPLLPLAVLLLALVVMQGTLLYYSGSNDTYWTLFVIIGYALFLVVGTLAIFGFGAGLFLLLVLLFIGIFMGRRAFRQVPEGYVDIVLLSGRYARTLYPGFNLKMPWEKVSSRLSTKEISWTCPEQIIKISRDQDVKLVATISYQLMPEDSHIAALNVDNWEESLKKQFVGTLLSVINELEPADFLNWPQRSHGRTSLDIGSIDDATITRWDRINELLANRMRDKVAEWGVQINYVRIQNITLIPHLASMGNPPAGMTAWPVDADKTQGANPLPAQPSEAAESPVTHQEEALTIRFAIGKLNDYLLWFLMVLEVTLLIEFFLMLIGADPNNLFTGFMYALTVIPLYAFNGIVPSTKLGTGGAAIEWSTLIAMAVYFLVFYALRRFLYILISSPEEPVVERTRTDLSVIRSAINNASYSNYQQLSKAIIHRIGATDETLIEPSRFVLSTVWEISLPSIGLRLDTGKAIFFLRNLEEDTPFYERLIKIKSAKEADFLLVVDYLNIGKSPPPIDSGIVWLKPENLKEIVETPRNEVKAWLGRLIASQVKNFEDLIPYHTEGSAEPGIFFGRNYELERLSRGAARGGVIVGAHKSGKSSLLAQLSERLKKQNYVVGGPYTIRSERFEIFFQDTLRKLDIALPIEVNLESWASAIINASEKGQRLVLLLDEVDKLLEQDARDGNNLGREMRALQNDGYCKFYLAGHSMLRKVASLESGPFRNFAEEFTLKGLEVDAAIDLIQEPIKAIGFNVSRQQALRIFEGTGGVAVLIQDFCKRLLLRVKSGRKFDIEDAAIKKVEEDPDYVNGVYDYYKYAQNWDSLAVTVITARLNQATRQEIIQKFSEYGATLTWDQLDNLLNFLLKFGVLKEFETGKYEVLSKYLCKALEARSPNSDAFLLSLFEEGKGR